MDNFKPNLFIVGFPKSGTTSLHNYLSSHEEVYMSEVKEIGYFSNDFHDNKVVTNFWPCPRNELEYLRYLRNSKFGKFKYIGESTPHYIFSENAPENIYNFNKDSKVIILLRNPFNFINSIFENRRRESHKECFSEFLQRPSLTSKKGEVIPVYERCNYSKYLKRYLDIFPRNNLSLVLFEDLIENPEETYFGLLESLSLKIKEPNNGFLIHNSGGSYKKQKDSIDKSIKLEIFKYIQETNCLLRRYGFDKYDLRDFWTD